MSEKESTESKDVPQELLKKLRQEAYPVRPSLGCAWWPQLLLLVVSILAIFGIWHLSDRIWPVIKGGQHVPLLPKQQPQATAFLGAFDGRICYFDPSIHDPNKLLLYDPSSGQLPVDGKLSSYDTFLWSPKGKIAFISRQDVGKGHIYYVDMTQPELEVKQITQRRQDSLSDDFVLRADSPMVWSPNETAIAFVAFSGDTSDLFAAQVNGKGTWRITHYKAHISSVAWVSTGWIAFVSDMDGREKRYLIKTDGGGLHEW